MAKKVFNLNTATGAKSWEDSATLPTPTANKLLRANGTEWVASVNSSLTDGNANAEFKISNNASPTTKYSHTYISDTEADFVVQLASNKGTNIYSNSSYSQCTVKSGTNEYIWIYADANNKILTLKPQNANEQTLSLKTTRNYDSTSKILEFYGKFDIYQNGKIVSNYLSGSTNQLIEVTPDGTIQRYTGTLPSAQVNSDWNATSGVAEILNKPTIHNYIEFTSEPLTVISDGYSFSNTQLGLGGVNLNEKIKMAQCYVIQADYPNVKNNELVMGHNVEDGQISVRLNFNLAVGDRIKIYLEYID